jgi:uncharacterized OB-fold protein
MKASKSQMMADDGRWKTDEGQVSTITVIYLVNYEFLLKKRFILELVRLDLYR